MTAERDDPIELSRRLVYFAAERTLSAWIRTALSLMALGFVIDRFGLILHRIPAAAGHGELTPRLLSTWGGSVLVGMGAVMALAAGVRYVRFALAYRRNGDTHVGHGMVFGALFAFILGGFGLALIAALAAALP
jgi:putative membrane protein